MTKREKRLKKGIESIDKQIEIHEEKKSVAKKEGNLERVKYYEKEIGRFEQEKEKKESYLED